MKRLNLGYFIAVALIVSAISTKSLFASGRAVVRDAVPVNNEMNNSAETDSVILKGSVSKEELHSYLARPLSGSKLTTLLKGNIKYPEAASENGIKGKVQVLFTVDKNGSVSDIKVIETPHEELSGEVEKALKQVRFEPVIQNGMPLQYKLILPVRFELL